MDQTQIEMNKVLYEPTTKSAAKLTGIGMGVALLGGAAFLTGKYLLSSMRQDFWLDGIQSCMGAVILGVSTIATVAGAGITISGAASLVKIGWKHARNWQPKP